MRTWQIVAGTEAGQLVLELSDYQVQDIAQTVRSTLEPLAADKKLGFKVEVAPQLPSGRGDGRRLTQVGSHQVHRCGRSGYQG
jgi:signal transduction histidine kinase